MCSSKQIAERIRGRAKEIGITQKALLESAGLGRNTMAHLNEGKSISSDSLARLADVLSCSVDYLLGRGNNPQGEPLDISEIEFALSGEIRDLSEAEKQDVLDYVRFKRSQKAGAKNDN